MAPAQWSAGLASWYGPGFEGRATAYGEIFDSSEFTAASRIHAPGTLLVVAYKSRRTVVRINDRGPFVAGRDIDLSYGTARHLGMLDTGLERVRLEILPG